MHYKTTLAGLLPKARIAEIIRRDLGAVCQAEITWLEQSPEQLRFEVKVWHRVYDLATWRETAMFDRPAAGRLEYASDAIVTLRDRTITRWASPDKAGQLGCEIVIEHPERDLCARTVSKALQKLLAPGQLIVDPADAKWGQHRR